MTDDTQGLSEEALAEIEARANAASPGPWVNGADLDEGFLHLGRVLGPDRETVILYEESDWPPRRVPTDEDSEFIAHARTDVPALVQEVRRLRSLLGAERLKAIIVEEVMDDHTLQACNTRFAAEWLAERIIERAIGETEQPAPRPGREDG